MSFAFLSEWSAFLPREGGHLIVLRGGGGKTSLLAAMADALGEAGVPTAVTRGGDDGSLDWPDLHVCPIDALPTAPPARLHVTAPGGAPGGLPPADIDALVDALPEHVLLYEVDSGVGHSVVRSVADVLPARTSLLLTVAGLDAIGGDARDATPPDRPVPSDWLSPGDDGPVWSWDGLRALLADLPDRPPGAEAPTPHLPALLRLGACRDGVGLFDCLGRLMDPSRCPLVLLGDTSGPEPRLRTAYLDGEEA